MEGVRGPLSKWGATTDRTAHRLAANGTAEQIGRHYRPDCIGWRAQKVETVTGVEFWGTPLREVPVSRIRPASPPTTGRRVPSGGDDACRGASDLVVPQLRPERAPLSDAMSEWGSYELSKRVSLTMRDRELLIDRTCARCGCEYEWGVHRAFFAERVGLTAEQIASLAQGEPTDPCWVDPRDRLLLHGHPRRLTKEHHDRERATATDGMVARSGRAAWSRGRGYGGDPRCRAWHRGSPGRSRRDGLLHRSQ
ncbi:MAG: carboxymuconolactone decarboxylase family protein [Acidimicrobiales bacterium]